MDVGDDGARPAAYGGETEDGMATGRFGVAHKGDSLLVGQNRSGDIGDLAGPLGAQMGEEGAQVGFHGLAGPAGL